VGIAILKRSIFVQVQFRSVSNLYISKHYLKASRILTVRAL
jgi:hypothetical protein